MKTPRMMKVWNDLRREPGKSVMLMLAIAIGVFSLGTMLGSYAVLSREMRADYLATQPASATLKIEHRAVAPQLVEWAANQGQVAAAERRATILARMKVGEDWYPLLLFVVDDFSRMRLNRVEPESGQWPPPPGTLLVERTALGVMQARTGDRLQVRAPSGRESGWAISGVVYDAGLAPAWQEKMGYGYVTAETMKALEPEFRFDELRVAIDDSQATAEQIDAWANGLAVSLAGQGYPVHEILVPPPRFHPHQGQMTAVLSLFSIFGLLTLILAAILVTVAIYTLMIRQTREIGVMKAVGAQAYQIRWLYLLMMAGLSLAATLAAIPLSLLAVGRMVEAISVLLNLKINNPAIPFWVMGGQLLAGLLIPLLVASVPLGRASRMTVRQAITNYGLTTRSSWGLGRLLARRTAHLKPEFTLALRNIFRQQSRLAMVLVMLAVAGATFLTAVNTSNGWNQLVQKVFSTRNYDLQIDLASQRQDEETVLRGLAGLEGVKWAESWMKLPVSFGQALPVSTMRTYPDKRHASSFLMGISLPSKAVSFPVMAGRWLAPGGKREVVLNHYAHGRMPGAKVGDTIRLQVEGRWTDWTLVGIVEEVGNPAATAYVSKRELGGQVSGAEGYNTLRVAMDDRSPQAAMASSRRIEARLAALNVVIGEAIPMTVIRSAMGDHMAVLVSSLILLALLMALVGVIGLSATMSMNVLERTREMGVLRAVGAGRRQIYWIIMTEGLITGLLSLVFTLPLAHLATTAMGRFIGNMAFRTPMDSTLSHLGLGLWVVILVAGSLAATYWPARRAAALTPREALAYE